MHRVKKSTEAVWPNQRVAAAVVIFIAIGVAHYFHASTLQLHKTPPPVQRPNDGEDVTPRANVVSSHRPTWQRLIPARPFENEQLQDVFRDNIEVKCVVCALLCVVGLN
jgi:hypothetical protein